MPTLDWLNRASAFTTAAKVPYRLLEQVSAHTSHAENTTNSIAPQTINTPARGQNGTQNGLNTDNLLIQGDKRPASGNVLHRDGLNMKQQLDTLLAA